MKTECRHIEASLAPLAAGELSVFERRRVEAHLAACATCGAEWRREQKLRALAADLPEIACPDHVTAAIAAAVDRDQARRRRINALRRVWPRVAATSALAAAAAVLLLVLAPAKAPSPTMNEPVAAVTPTAPAPELAQARRDVMHALALTAAVFDRTERRLFADVFRLLEPAARAADRFDLSTTNNGGQG